MGLSHRVRIGMLVLPATLALAMLTTATVTTVLNSPANSAVETPVAQPVQQFQVSDHTANVQQAGKFKTPAASTPQRGGGYVASNADADDTVQWPLAGRDRNLTDGFGPRTPPCPVCSSNHRGQDFAGTEGEPVASIADGTVVEVVPKPGASTLGAYVVIKHKIDGKTVHSVYAHLVSGSVTVRVNDHVRVGDQIGRLGNTGASTGPHLHLEVLVNKVHVDPLAYLRKYADGKPVKIRTLPEVNWGQSDGSSHSDESDGWQPKESQATPTPEPNPAAPQPSAPETTDPASPAPSTPAVEVPQESTPQTEAPEPTGEEVPVETEETVEPSEPANEHTAPPSNDEPAPSADATPTE